MLQIHNYKEYVDTDKITFEGNLEEDFRYLLKVPFKRTEGKKVLVILKNPSKANKEISDTTINKVLYYCNNEKYSVVYIMNLFSYYGTDPKAITKLIDKGELKKAIGKDSDEIMKETVKKVNEIIVAWGGNSINRKVEYKNRIKQVLDIIKHKKLFYIQSISKCNWYPRHAQVWHTKKGIRKAPWRSTNLKE